MSDADVYILRARRAPILMSCGMLTRHLKHRNPHRGREKVRLIDIHSLPESDSFLYITLACDDTGCLGYTRGR